MSDENQMVMTRRVIGLAGAGVMPERAVALYAREVLAKASERGFSVKASDQVLQKIAISVLPDPAACRSAVAELDSCVASFVEQRRNPSFERPRSR